MREYTLEQIGTNKSTKAYDFPGELPNQKERRECIEVFKPYIKTEYFRQTMVDEIKNIILNLLSESDTIHHSIKHYKDIAIHLTMKQMTVMHERQRKSS